MTDRLIPEPTPTGRGFLRADFKDANGKSASIQESSVATECMLWLGIEQDRMHLNEQLVRELVALMSRYADHGTLLTPEEPEAVGDLRDALAAANAHVEAQAERITYLEGHREKLEETYKADTDRYTAQMAQLSANLTEGHRLYQKVVAERDAAGEQITKLEIENTHLEFQVVTLKAKLYDIMAREGSVT